MRRAEGGAKIFGVFRVKNQDFTPKNIFYPILGGEGARAGCAPPLDPPLVYLFEINSLAIRRTVTYNEERRKEKECVYGHIFLALKTSMSISSDSEKIFDII